MRLYFVAFLVWASACHMPNLCTFGNGAPCPSGTFCYAGEQAQVGDMGICVHPRTAPPPPTETPHGETPSPPEPEPKPEPAAELRVELLPSLIGFSPLGTDASVEVVVSGFKTRADASRLKLDMGLLDKPTWVTLGDGESTPTEDSTHIRFSIQYNGKDFGQSAGGTIRLRLGNIPEGYAYNETHNIRVVVENGTPAYPISVSRANIEAFNTHANTGVGLGLHYRLVENIMLPSPEEGESNWTPIGSYASETDNNPFTGSFDGDAHTLSGLVIHAPDEDCQALFGHIGKNAVVKNIGLQGVSVTGNEYVGSLVGQSNGTVHNSYAIGEVRGNWAVGGLVGASEGVVESSYAEGNIDGGGYLGGLVGLNYGTVRDSHAEGAVSGSANRVGGLVGLSNSGTVHNSYAIGEVRGNDFVGGLVGQNSSTVHSSYATSAVRGNTGVGGLVGWNFGSTVRNSYATGEVSGKENVGGLVGISLGGTVGNTVENSYATGNVSGTNYVGGLLGYNSGTLENSVALNSTTTGKTYIGRVAGLKTDHATLTNNHARSDMDIRLGVDATGGGGTEKTISSDADDVDGQDVCATATGQYADVDFWRGVLAEFDIHWEWNDDTQLPTLKGVGGEQNHGVQPPP